VKTCIQCQVLKNESDFGKNKRKKDGLCIYCKQCNHNKYEENKDVVKKRSSAYRENNKERIVEYKKQYYKKNKKKLSLKSKKYYIKNREQVKRVCVKYAAMNKDKVSKYSAEWRKNNCDSIKKYRKDHKGKIYAHNAKRRAMKLGATPTYADPLKIERIYRTAQILSKMTGREFHVDHIIPLQNDLVCGLHHQDNLQIISAERNLRKNNKFEPIIIDY